MLHLFALPVIVWGGFTKDPGEGQEQRRFQQPIDEFFLTDTVNPTDRGELETHVEFGMPRYANHATGFAFAEYGISDLFNVTLATPSLLGDGNKSLADWSASGSFLLVSNNPNFAVAAQLGVAATEGETGHARSWTASPSLLAARQVGRAQLHAQLETDLAQGQSSASLRLAALYDAHAWTPTLELSGVSSSTNPAVLVAPGVYYHLTKKIEFGLGAPLRLYRGGDTPKLIGIFTVDL